jgi:galactose oxidase-like protein
MAEVGVRATETLVRCMVILAGTAVLGSQPAFGSNRTTGRWYGPYEIGVQGTHTAVLRDTLNDSTKVLIYGFTPGTGTRFKYWDFLPSATLHHPLEQSATSHLLPVKEASSDLFCSGLSTLGDGRLLVTGGSVGGQIGHEYGYTFDPVQRPTSGDTASLVVGPTFAQGHWYPTNTTMYDGSVLVNAGTWYPRLFMFGGRDADSARSDLRPLRLSNLTRRWETPNVTGADGLPAAREGHTAGWDDRGDQNPQETQARGIVMFGGDTNGLGTADGKLRDVWRLGRSDSNGVVTIFGTDTTWKWQKITVQPDSANGYPARRSHHSQVLYQNGGFLIYGGLDSTGTALSDVWRLYKDDSGTWHWKLVTANAPAGARYGHSAGFFSGPTMVVFGGKNNAGQPLADTWSLTASGPMPQWTWTNITPGGESPAKRAFAASGAQTGGGDVVPLVVFGGEGTGGTVLGDVWRLDPGQGGAWVWTHVTCDSSAGKPSPRKGGAPIGIRKWAASNSSVATRRARAGTAVPCGAWTIPVTRSFRCGASLPTALLPQLQLPELGRSSPSTDACGTRLSLSSTVPRLQAWPPGTLPILRWSPTRFSFSVLMETSSTLGRGPVLDSIC